MSDIRMTVQWDDGEEAFYDLAQGNFSLHEGYIYLPDVKGRVVIVPFSNVNVVTLAALDSSELSDAWLAKHRAKGATAKGAT